MGRPTAVAVAERDHRVLDVRTDGPPERDNHGRPLLAPRAVPGARRGEPPNAGRGARHLPKCRPGQERERLRQRARGPEQSDHLRERLGRGARRQPARPERRGHRGGNAAQAGPPHHLDSEDGGGAGAGEDGEGDSKEETTVVGCGYV